MPLMYLGASNGELLETSTGEGDRGPEARDPWARVPEPRSSWALGHHGPGFLGPCGPKAVGPWTPGPGTGPGPAWALGPRNGVGNLL